MDDILTIYDNYSGNPVFSRTASHKKAYSFDHQILILLCIGGSGKFILHMKEYVLTRDSFLVIDSGTPFFYTENSDDFMVNILDISESVFEKLTQGIIKIYFQKMLNDSPMHMIPREKMEMCSNIHRYLKMFVVKNDNFFKKQIIRNYLNIFFYEACNIMLREPQNPADTKSRHKDEISSQFIKHLEHNIRKSRKVEFYARLMNITPKYLSAIIKETTGRPASAWIDDYTVVEARELLTNSDETIQQISYDLGFSSPSHFAKFFRDRTGQKPKEARISD